MFTWFEGMQMITVLIGSCYSCKSDGTTYIERTISNHLTEVSFCR